MQMGFAPPTFLLNIDEAPNGILVQPHSRYFWKTALCVGYQIGPAWALKLEIMGGIL
ncbi:hypothetical protein MKX03_017147, partial [Papaver bracteatum]